MNAVGVQAVDVFPITTAAFGLRSDWFVNSVPKLIHPAYLLMILFLVISIGILALRRFENADLEKKLWNIPIIILATGLWPVLILNLKELIDTFNAFLVHDVFQISWQGFGFPDMGSTTTLVGWSAEAIARLVPNLAYWVIYAFYIVFFFFFAVLGPFILAKGILFDEIEAFLELIKEITILFLWQTTVVILVSLIMPDIVSGKSFPVHPEANFYFLSLILGVMIFFVPSMTQKFGNHLGHSFFPPGFRMGGAVLGLTALGRIGGLGLSALGVRVPPVTARLGAFKEKVLHAEEFKKRYENSHHVEDLRYEKARLERDLREEDEDEKKIYKEVFNPQETTSERSNLVPLFGSEKGPLTPNHVKVQTQLDNLLSLSKKANAELRDDQ